MLFILSSDTDLTADFLIVELINRGLPYFRLNSEDLASAEFNFSLSADGVCRRLSVGPRALDLEIITAVWYRRSIQPSVSPELSPGERRFVAGELRHLATGLVLNPGVIWVNPMDRVSIAENKVFQLRVARKLGFRIPRTLVSRDPEELKSFASSNPAGTICKPIFHGLFADEKGTYSIYTRRIFAGGFDAQSVKLCPVFLQEEIPRIADVRATFIGAKCFVVDIKGESSLIDWRDPENRVTYSESALGGTEQSMCRAMLEELGLRYGAFDFLRTPEGELVFLEINPTGEWAWLEDRLGFPMREAFVELFFGS